MLAVGCGSASKREIKAARGSLYDAEFATVYSAALAVTRDLYPQLQDNPGPGRISTAWHQVSYGNNQDNLQMSRTLAAGQGVPQGAQGVGTQGVMSGVPTRLAYKRYFVRFDVSVIGGRPWRVKVVGQASEWDPGAAMPTPMNGAQRPAWLDGRIDALQVAIYRRMKRQAVPMPDTSTEGAGEAFALPKTDPAAFQGVPAGAAQVLARLKDGLDRRDPAAIRTLLAEEVVWSLGGGTGADVAIATWQADPGTFDSMQAALAAGCARAAGSARVACPGGPPARGVYQLLLAEVGGAWRVVSFVQGE